MWRAPLGFSPGPHDGPPLSKNGSHFVKTALVSSSAIKLLFGFLICMCEPGVPAWAEGGAQPFLTSKRTLMRVDSEKQLLENGHRLWKNPILCCAKILHGKLICRRVIVSLSGKYTHALLFLISGLLYFMRKNYKYNIIIITVVIIM